MDGVDKPSAFSKLEGHQSWLSCPTLFLNTHFSRFSKIFESTSQTGTSCPTTVIQRHFDLYQNAQHALMAAKLQDLLG
jgi:hypothetical protein